MWLRNDNDFCRAEDFALQLRQCFGLRYPEPPVFSIRHIPDHGRFAWNASEF
jgi:hypothetical protein